VVSGAKRPKSHAPKPFIEGWSRAFGDVAATGWLLRKAFPQRWVRFHALPQSKRFPETEEEHLVVLRRLLVLGDDLFGKGHRVWQVHHNEWCDPSRVDWRQEAQGFLMPTTKEDGMDGLHLNVNISRPHWPPPDLPELVRQIALDRTRALYVDLEVGRVLAPYDGGVDIICTGPEEVATLRQSHPNWLSTHPLGL
jgi:hypothetical protein